MTAGRAERLRALILNDPWRRQVLAAVRALALPDWAIGAGFVRSAVWDHLHGFTAHTALDDVDVIFFDRADPAKARERDLEAHLRAELPDVPWSVKNQARMHLRNDDPPYRDTLDALFHWLETPTSVSVRLEADETLRVLAPHGLDDLWDMRARPTPSGRRHHGDYVARMRKKDWPGRWPRVEILGL